MEHSEKRVHDGNESICSARTVLEHRPGSAGTYGETNADAVDVKAAIEEYNELKRELSRVSRVTVSQHESKLEEGTADQDVFNLDEFLRGVTKSEEEAGKTPKSLGLIWRDLTVEGLGADAHTIPTAYSYIFQNLQVWKRFGIGVGGTKKTILRNLTGFCKPGEMVLVLGRPGSGCTTLLKVLSNMRAAYTNIDGTVSYGGIDHETFAKHYRGQVVYNEEEDQHYPTLTTKQTLQFALRTKTPGNRLPNESKDDFVNKVLYMLGNMLGLTKQMNTMVGNAFVRGLSGGERKRLSIAEAMTAHSSINLWDCSTRGLDAASALDYVRALRIMTDILNKSTISTLYQASESIFNLFDKVVLLDEGRCIYFGPTDKAKSYFEELGFYCPPRKSTPDFLTGLCNPLERQFKPGFENSAPKYAQEFEERYLQSSVRKDMIAELEAYEALIEQEKPQEVFKAAVHEEHQKRASKNQPYTASFYQQVKALTIRQYHLLLKDRTALLSRYGTLLIQAFIMGSCFYAMPLDTSGGYSRAGAIMFSVIFNAFISNSELVGFMTGRPVLEKHKHFGLYRPSAMYLAQVIMDVPYAVVQVFLFSIIVYFLMGLKLSAGAFFSFCVTLFFINMMMNGYFRFFGSITSSFFVANQLSIAFFVSMVNYFGFLIPYQSMHPWLFWIYWIDPMAYGFKSLIINEMSGQIYSCDGEGNSVPFGPGYEDWRYKACNMKGSKPGQNFVYGDDYLREALNYEPRHQWAPDFVVVIGFFLLFAVLTCLALEFSAASSVGSMTKLYLPGKAPKPRTIEEENERRKEQEEITKKMDNISTGTTFSWHHVNYTVSFKGGPLQLLNDVSGIVKPGHLTALMGSSGAGKTTLLDVLARRKTIGKVEGRIYLNNEALMKDFERITGYCEQMDIHQPAVTVREALQFSAYLRQDPSVPKKEKDDYVEQILQLLEMEGIADAQIGEIEHGTGISVEERKRLTIAMELVSKPQLLFLDEPTSGLDAQSSYNIVRFIRKLADAGWPVLCTIHQPSAILFEHFDHLLLLVRGGKTAYYGEIGPDARTMIDYFESNGGPKCGPDTNPAEYILEVVGAGTAGKVTQDWPEIWKNSPQAKALEEELEEIHKVADKNPTRKALTYATPFWTQFYLVMKRLTIAYWRTPEYTVGRFIPIMFTALLFGFTYWKMSYTSTDMQNRLFVLFDSFMMAYLVVVMAQPKFMTERLYFRREHASRFYGWAPFAISAILVEIPYILFYCALFMCGFYWTAGLVNTSEAAGYFYLMMFFFVCWAYTLGFVIAAASDSPTMASVLVPIFVSTLVLFGGCFQPPQSMPYFWRSWIYWLDPFHYFIEGLAVNEMANLPVICNEADLVKMSVPVGQTCGEYFANFFSSGAPGYIANPNATDICSYCPYKSGEEYYSINFGWDAANKWRNLGIIIAFFIFNVLVFMIFCFWKRKERR